MIQGIIPGGHPTLFNWVKGGTESFTVPAGFLYWLRWAVLNYNRDANVGDVAIAVRMTLINTKYGYLFGFSPMVANTSYNLCWGLGNTGSYGAQVVISGDPLPLYPGTKVEAIAYSGKAGDDWWVEGMYFKTPLLGAT